MRPRIYPCIIHLKGSRPVDSLQFVWLFVDPLACMSLAVPLPVCLVYLSVGCLPACLSVIVIRMGGYCDIVSHLLFTSPPHPLLYFFFPSLLPSILPSFLSLSSLVSRKHPHMTNNHGRTSGNKYIKHAGCVDMWGPCDAQEPELAGAVIAGRQPDSVLLSTGARMPLLGLGTDKLKTTECIE
jgi:hypothetical protein